MNSFVLSNKAPSTWATHAGSQLFRCGKHTHKKNRSIRKVFRAIPPIILWSCVKLCPCNPQSPNPTLNPKQPAFPPRSTKHTFPAGRHLILVLDLGREMRKDRLEGRIVLPAARNWVPGTLVNGEENTKMGKLSGGLGWFRLLHWFVALRYRLGGF